MQFFFNLNEDIPEQFYSGESHSPHTECSVCGNGFGDDYYFIEKAYQKTYDNTQFEVTFEYAICEKCKRDMMKSISKESFKHIQEFATGGKSFSFDLMTKNSENLDFLLSHCISSGKPIDELQEYHLIGIFKGNKMVQIPMLYGESFIEEYADLLSEETKGFFDDFFNNITVLPPTLAKLLEDDKPKKRPVII